MVERNSAGVLVAVDGSAAALAAVEWGAQESQTLDRELRLVHVIGWPFDSAFADVGAQGSEARDEAAEISAQLLAEAAAHAAASVSASKPSTVTRWGPVGRTLLEEAATAHTLVVGRHNRSGFAGTLLGSLGLGIAARASCPVVVVPETSRGSWRSLHPRVVVGIDGSPSSSAALEYALAFADRHALTLEALMAGGHADRPGPGAEQAEGVGAMLDAGGQAYPGVRVTERRVGGRPVEALTAAAVDAALLVVGCRGRSGGPTTMLGSVSRGVVYLARCPVAVV